MSTPTPRFRPILDQFAPYKPGKPPATRPPAAPTSSRRTSHRSARCPPWSRSSLRRPAEVNRYPDNGAAELTEAIAARYGVPASHIAVGCGSVGLVQQLLEAVADPGAEVLYAWRSFEAYPYLADLAGATSVRVPLRRRAARPDGDGGRDHRRDQADLRLHPEQPDRNGRRHRRACPVPRPGASATAWSCSTRPTRSTCAIRRCRTASRYTGTGRTWPCCGPSPRPTVWPGCGSASWSGTSRWRRRPARPCSPSR